MLAPLTCRLLSTGKIRDEAARARNVDMATSTVAASSRMSTADWRSRRRPLARHRSRVTSPTAEALPVVLVAVLLVREGSAAGGVVGHGDGAVGVEDLGVAGRPLARLVAG